jgi:hypothetical protein
MVTEICNQEGTVIDDVCAVCRYDVALDVNVMGVKHICQLAKQCPNLEVVLHVSTGN